MKKYAPMLIVLAGCLWGTMGLFVRHLNEMGLASMQIVELRSIIAALLLFPITFFKDKKLLKIRIHQLWPLVCSGLFSIVFFNFCYFSTISIMNLSMAAILLYTAPMFVMLLSVVLFQEKLTARKLTALGFAFGGCCLVCGILNSSVSITLPGLLLGLGSGLGYALYSIFSRFSLNQGLHPIAVTDYTFLFAAIGGAALTDFSSIEAIIQQYGVTFIAFAIFYTVVTTVLPYLLYTTGLRYVENGTASVIASIEPVVATILGFLVFAETPTLSTLLGIILVVLALVLLNQTNQE
ncbi:MAG: EamA family transporter [Clostridiales bacterium]|nr:EamA family transporter [Clostridiales bacterium]